jgi:hypothetical protein
VALLTVRRALAQWLHRWAESVLPEEGDAVPVAKPEPEADPDFFPLGGGPPPAHWVELVKDAAPELLLPPEGVVAPPADLLPAAWGTDGHGQARTATDVPRTAPALPERISVETPRGASPEAAWVPANHQATAGATERPALTTKPRPLAAQTAPPAATKKPVPTIPTVETPRGASPEAAWITSHPENTAGATYVKTAVADQQPLERDAPRGVSTVERKGTPIDRPAATRTKPPLPDRRLSPFRPASHPPGSAGVPPAPTTAKAPTVAAQIAPPTEGRPIDVPRIDTQPRPEPSAQIATRTLPPPPGVITVNTKSAPPAAPKRQPKPRWPALPDRPLDDPDNPAAERAVQQSWERRQRLDREQQGV